jgi:hypothetical protein
MSKFTLSEGLASGERTRDRRAAPSPAFAARCDAGKAIIGRFDAGGAVNKAPAAKGGNGAGLRKEGYEEF